MSCSIYLNILILRLLHWSERSVGADLLQDQLLRSFGFHVPNRPGETSRVHLG